MAILAIFEGGHFGKMVIIRGAMAIFSEVLFFLMVTYLILSKMVTILNVGILDSLGGPWRVPTSVVIRS